MKKLQFYKYATGALLLMNISMIAFFFLTRPNPPHKGGGQEFSEKAIGILKLDGQQQDRFLQAAKEHNQQMEAINDQQRDLLKPYFSKLLGSANNIATDSLLFQVQQLERKKIEYTYQHFQEVKSMLTAEQQAGFEKFMNRALEIILLEKKKNTHPPMG